MHPSPNPCTRVARAQIELVAQPGETVKLHAVEQLDLDEGYHLRAHAHAHEVPQLSPLHCIAEGEGLSANGTTGHGSQGSEADIVILSLVRSNTKMQLGHARDRRRINVALSRAKDRLIVVGNSDCFRTEGVWKGLWRCAHQQPLVT